MSINAPPSFQISLFLRQACFLRSPALLSPLLHQDFGAFLVRRFDPDFSAATVHRIHPCEDSSPMDLSFMRLFCRAVHRPAHYHVRPGSGTPKPALFLFEVRARSPFESRLRDRLFSAAVPGLFTNSFFYAVESVPALPRLSCFFDILSPSSSPGATVFSLAVLLPQTPP